eukprot:TRINITY_DN8511_c0_g1_i1.p1 TRINITY_DN8511_c0_g1~~TRINITY_DN8511_c0_g1_i1.p1  ORF type:complete len:222 (-),score=46.47 TRINITY_DN8511_c0_g1_i1:105-770(-)
MENAIGLNFMMVGTSGAIKAGILAEFSKVDSDASTPGDGVKHVEKTFTTNDKEVKVKLIDLNNQPRESNYSSTSCFKGVQGVFLIFELGKQDTFEELQDWVTETEKYAKKDIQKMIIGSKEKDVAVVVPFQDVQTICNKYGIEYFEVSVDSGVNLEAAMKRMIDKCLSKSATQTKVSTSNDSAPNSPNVVGGKKSDKEQRVDSKKKDETEDPKKRKRFIFF